MKILRTASRVQFYWFLKKECTDFTWTEKTCGGNVT